MVYVLSNLYNCSPSVRSELLFAIIALRVGLYELGNEGLLYFGIVVQLLLDCYFDLDSLRVFLGPDETSVDDFGSVQSPDFLQQNRKELLAVPLACNPRWPHETVAKATEVYDSLLGDSNSNIGFGQHAGFAHIA